MATQKQYKYTLPIGYKLKGGENDYVIEEVLGKGGFGVTYKVKATIMVKKIPFDLHFAVKEYFPDICSREADNATIKIPETKHDEIADGIKDFINEGKKLQAVCDLNPNIVNVNEVFQANGTAYYVLEYLEGGDLRKMVKSNGGALSEQQMLDVMIPVGRAVQCLHDNNILHLDIKPDNIVMRHNSKGEAEPVLIDFGIAVHFRSDGTPTSKTPSQGISPGYSPIEQYALITTFDPRIDIYAFSATCLYLLTGKDPMEAMSLLKQPNYIKSIIPATANERVTNAIESGMSIIAQSRPQSMNAMLAMLTGDVIEDVEVVDVVEEEDTIQNDTVSLAPRGKSTVVNGNHSKESISQLSSAQKSEHQPKSQFKSKSHTRDNYNENLTFNINGVRFTMVAVKGGTFTMGATREQDNNTCAFEKPAHSVKLSSYYIGQTEVTQELWEAVMGSNPSYFNGTKRPVEQVSWDDCQKFIRKLNEKTGKQFRLPSEAEWEYAARGGNKSHGYKYSGSNTLSDVAWHYGNSGSTTHDVATKRANELRIYDMSGNVWEWCQDNWYNYDGSATEYGSNRVNRGGGWYNGARNCRVSNRLWNSADRRYYNLGLRLAL